MVYIALLSAAILIGIDQFIKAWAITYLAEIGTMSAIPYLLDFTYVENYGAAYGIMSGKTGILIILTSVIMIAMIGLLLSRRFKHKMVTVSITLIIAGGIGNLIDRITRGFVIDYLDIGKLFDFPVFNFADSCVVIGSILFVIYEIFIDGKGSKKSANVIGIIENPEGVEIVYTTEGITEEPLDLIKASEEIIEEEK